MSEGLTLRATLLSEFDDEIAITRRFLERLPDGAFGWKPHDRSMTLGALATHLAHIPHWGTAILQHERYDLEDDHTEAASELNSRAAVLAVFARHAAEVRGALAALTDAGLAACWSLTRGGQMVMSLPKASAIRRFVLNHLVHHRGQLTVYLRMQDVPLPPSYGPTADEPM
jgi:uncharacterized damage-inducible protein DinB